jgi:hypothetical protein
MPFLFSIKTMVDGQLSSKTSFRLAADGLSCAHSRVPHLGTISHEKGPARRQSSGMRAPPQPADSPQTATINGLDQGTGDSLGRSDDLQPRCTSRDPSHQETPRIKKDKGHTGAQKAAPERRRALLHVPGATGPPFAPADQRSQGAGSFAERRGHRGQRTL